MKTAALGMLGGGRGGEQRCTANAEVQGKLAGHLCRGAKIIEVFEGDFSSVAGAIHAGTLKYMKRLAFQFSVWGEE